MEELGVFGCDALSFVEWFATFRSKVVSSSSRVMQSKKFTRNLFQNAALSVDDVILYSESVPFYD